MSSSSSNDSGSEIDDQVYDTTPPEQTLIGAAQRGNMSTVTEIIGAGVDVNYVDKLGNTALMYACAGGHAETVQYLIDNGADVTVVNTFGDSTIHKAVWADSEECVAALVAAGVDVDAKNNDNKTAMDLVKSGEVGVVLQQAKLAAQFDGDDQDDDDLYGSDDDSD